jgi:hypothetical protein
MKSWVEKKGIKQETDAEEMETFVSQDSEVEEFIAGLHLLEYVPASYLLPNPDILKTEQMCFFYLDSNWISYMIQGALHIGSTCRQEHMCSRAMYGKLYQAGWNRAYNLRNVRLGVLHRNVTEETVCTGFLLRSEAVRCWPGIEVRCLKSLQEENTQKELDILRLDKLSDDTLLCIAAGEIQRVELSQPEEGIWFGVETDSKKRRNNEGEQRNEGVLNIEEIVKNYVGEQKAPEHFAEQMLHHQKRYLFEPNISEYKIF